MYRSVMYNGNIYLFELGSNGSYTRTTITGFYLCWNGILEERNGSYYAFIYTYRSIRYYRIVNSTFVFDHYIQAIFIYQHSGTWEQLYLTSNSKYLLFVKDSGEYVLY